MCILLGSWVCLYSQGRKQPRGSARVLVPFLTPDGLRGGKGASGCPSAGRSQGHTFGNVEKCVIRESMGGRVRQTVTWSESPNCFYRLSGLQDVMTSCVSSRHCGCRVRRFMYAPSAVPDVWLLPQN